MGGATIRSAGTRLIAEAELQCITNPVTFYDFNPGAACGRSGGSCFNALGCGTTMRLGGARLFAEAESQCTTRRVPLCHVTAW